MHSTTPHPRTPATDPSVTDVRACPWWRDGDSEGGCTRQQQSDCLRSQSRWCTSIEQPAKKQKSYIKSIIHVLPLLTSCPLPSLLPSSLSLAQFGRPGETSRVADRSAVSVAALSCSWCRTAGERRRGERGRDREETRATRDNTDSILATHAHTRCSCGVSSSTPRVGRVRQTHMANRSRRVGRREQRGGPPPPAAPAAQRSNNYSRDERSRRSNSFRTRPLSPSMSSRLRPVVPSSPLPCSRCPLCARSWCATASSRPPSPSHSCDTRPATDLTGRRMRRSCCRRRVRWRCSTRTRSPPSSSSGSSDGRNWSSTSCPGTHTRQATRMDRMDREGVNNIRSLLLTCAYSTVFLLSFAVVHLVLCCADITPTRAHVRICSSSNARS